MASSGPKKLRSTSDLARARRTMQPGGELYEYSKQLKKDQAPLRAHIDKLLLEAANAETRRR